MAGDTELALLAFDNQRMITIAEIVAGDTGDAITEEQETLIYLATRHVCRVPRAWVVHVDRVALI